MYLSIRNRGGTIGMLTKKVNTFQFAFRGMENYDSAAGKESIFLKDT
jgi:hypothetical protein